MSQPTRDHRCRARIAEGDAAALAELYDRYGEVLHAFAARIVGDRADARQVVAEAWSDAVEHAAQPLAPHGSVAAWLVDLVRARAQAALRAARAAGSRALAAAAEPREGNAPALPAPATGYAQRMLRREAAAAWSALGESQRRVLEAACLRGLAPPAIAAELGADDASVRLWLRQALQRLHERMPLEELP